MAGPRRNGPLAPGSRAGSPPARARAPRPARGCAAGNPSRHAWPSRRSSRRGRARRTIPRPGRGRRGRRPSLADRRAARAARRAEGANRKGPGPPPPPSARTRAPPRPARNGTTRRSSRRAGDRDRAFARDDASGARFEVPASDEPGDLATGVEVALRAEAASSDQIDFGSIIGAGGDGEALDGLGRARPSGRNRGGLLKKAVGGTSSLSMRRPTVSRLTKPTACDGRLRPETRLVDPRQVCRAFFNRPERLGPPLHRPGRRRGRGHRRCRSSRRRPPGGGLGRGRHRGQAGVRSRGQHPAREARRCPLHAGRIACARIGFRGTATAFAIERARFPQPLASNENACGPFPIDGAEEDSVVRRRPVTRATRLRALRAGCGACSGGERATPRSQRTRPASVSPARALRGERMEAPPSCSTPLFDLACPHGKVPRAPGWRRLPG